MLEWTILGETPGSVEVHKLVGDSIRAPPKKGFKNPEDEFFRWICAAKTRRSDDGFSKCSGFSGSAKATGKICTVNFSGVIRVWDLTHGCSKVVGSAGKDARCLGWSQDCCASVNESGELLIFCTQSSRLTHRFVCAVEACSLAINHDAQLIVVAGIHEHLQCFFTKDGQIWKSHCFSLDQGKSVVKCSFIKDSNSLQTGHVKPMDVEHNLVTLGLSDGSVEVWRLHRGIEKPTLHVRFGIPSLYSKSINHLCCFDYSPDMSHLCSTDGRCLLIYTCQPDCHGCSDRRIWKAVEMDTDQPISCVAFLTNSLVLLVSENVVFSINIHCRNPQIIWSHYFSSKVLNLLTQGSVVFALLDGGLIQIFQYAPVNRIKPLKKKTIVESINESLSNDKEIENHHNDHNEDNDHHKHHNHHSHIKRELTLDNLRIYLDTHGSFPKKYRKKIYQSLMIENQNQPSDSTPLASTKADSKGKMKIMMIQPQTKKNTRKIKFPTSIRDNMIPEQMDYVSLIWDQTCFVNKRSNLSNMIEFNICKWDKELGKHWSKLGQSINDEHQLTEGLIQEMEKSLFFCGMHESEQLSALWDHICLKPNSSERWKFSVLIILSQIMLKKSMILKSADILEIYEIIRVRLLTIKNLLKYTRLMESRSFPLTPVDLFIPT